MTSKTVIDQIIAEIDAGGRRLPPLAERIKARDRVFAERAEKAKALTETNKQTTTPDQSEGDYYADKGSGGFTGD